MFGSAKPTTKSPDTLQTPRSLNTTSDPRLTNILSEGHGESQMNGMTNWETKSIVVTPGNNINLIDVEKESYESDQSNPDKY